MEHGNIKAKGVITNEQHQDLKANAAPATPASGYGRLYVKADKKIYFKDDAGVEYDLTTTGALPTGSITPWAGALASPPTGWIVCDGSAVSKITYAALFAVIGHTFAPDPGGGNFTLPDFTNRFPYGASEGSAAGNASVGSKNTIFTTLSGNDNTVIRNYSGGFGLGAGSPGGWYSNFDQMEPYLAVGFIIKT